MSKFPLFGKRLAELRRASGGKQEQIAELLNIVQPTVSKLESGAAEPSARQIDQLATYFGVSRWMLVGGTELASRYPGECLVIVDPAARVRWLVYFASALTSLTPAEKEAVFADAEIVRAACEVIKAYLYEPSHYTDPELNRELSPETVYAIDRSQVSRSHFMVLHAGHASLGAGQELEIALSGGLPVILLKPRGARVSRMVLGTYARLTVIEYGTAEELKAQLPRALGTVMNDLSTVKDIGDLDLGSRLRAHREALPLDVHAVAKAVGVSPSAIERLEAGGYEHPSLTIIRRLAKVLRTSVCALVDGVTTRPEDNDPVLRRSMDTLHAFAEEDGVIHSDVQRLFDAYSAEHLHHRLSVAEARAEPLTVREWRDRYAVVRTGGSGGNGSRGNQSRLAIDD